MCFFKLQKRSIYKHDDFRLLYRFVFQSKFTTFYLEKEIAYLYLLIVYLIYNNRMNDFILYSVSFLFIKQSIKLHIYLSICL